MVHMILFRFLDVMVHVILFRFCFMVHVILFRFWTTSGRTCGLLW